MAEEETGRRMKPRERMKKIRKERKRTRKRGDFEKGEIWEKGRFGKRGDLEKGEEIRKLSKKCNIFFN